MDAPTLEPGREMVPIVQSDATTYSPPLRGVLVTATGNIAISVMGGASRTVPIANAPFYLNYWITKIFDTNTNIADTDLHGLR